MRWSEYNPNPKGKRVGDCVVRALTKAIGKSWQEIYVDLCIEGYVEADLPSANSVWDRYLIGNGFKRALIPSDCPKCYTVADFADAHPSGVYVVGTGTHAVAVIDGIIYDAWQSQNEQPIYFYYREG